MKKITIERQWFNKNNEPTYFRNEMKFIDENEFIRNNSGLIKECNRDIYYYCWYRVVN